MIEAADTIERKRKAYHSYLQKIKQEENSNSKKFYFAARG